MSNPQAYSPDTLSEDKVAASPSDSSVFSGTTVANPIVAPVTTGYVDLEQVKRSQFKSLAGQFACYVGISTFTASLVVGFISLSRAIIDKPPTLPLSSRRSEFEVGLALGMIAIGLHIGVVIVGIRAGALCLR